MSMPHLVPHIGLKPVAVCPSSTKLPVPTLLNY